MQLTNYTPGMRGINIKDLGTRWIDPGQTIEIDEAEIVGALPDLGAAPGSASDANDALAAQLADANAHIADLQTTIGEQEAQIVDLQAQVDAATQPTGGKK